ncbi:serine hydrolase [Kribbella sp. NPDC005582]|uniref:serine hydrolase domain-containing protein n=1 Tax=Kribbella sp. NPDC005582 TaxID=3156893 RepID=UPI0033A4C65B
MSSLPRSTPDDQGLSTAAIDAFVAAMDASAQEFQTVMLLRHGHVVLEAEWTPYRLTDRHLLYSVSKSFTSTAIGLAVDAGLLSIDDKAVSFFGPEDLPETVSDNLAAMTVRHLLTMSTGHDEDTVQRMTRDDRMVRTFLGLEVEHEPGAPFVYNSGATYLLSAILQRVSGETLLDYLQSRLFEPLGITEATWGSSQEGITFGGWGLSLSTESMAKFGQLVLQRGLWEGRQLVPAEWFEAATTKQVSNDREVNPDWHQGYGFQFWRGRNNTYRADGAFGQFILAIPDHDAVLIITSASTDMQATLNLVWDHLLPALEGKEVPAVPRPSRLELLPPSGPAPQGGDGRIYPFEQNPATLRSVRWDADGTALFTFDDAVEFVHTPNGWHDAGAQVVTAAHGDGDVFVGTIRWVDTPHAAEFRCRISDGQLTVDGELNVSFSPLKFTITSRA